MTVAERNLPMSAELSRTGLKPRTRLLDRPPLWRVVGGVCLLGVAMTPGCRNGSQTAAFSNPFLSADRVPAPGTRIPAPGAAQPYYPGDAIPPLQSAPVGGQPFGAVLPQPGVTPIPPGDNVAASPLNQRPTIASNEPAVRIPVDESSVRFAQTPIPAVVPQATVETALRQTPVENSSMAASPGTMPSSPQVTLTPVYDSGGAPGLFRPPADPRATTPRTVPNTTPRIRLPGTNYDAAVADSGGIHTTSYEAPVQQMQATVLPPAGYVPETFGRLAGSSSPAATDAFRPRGSARQWYEQSSPIATATHVPTLHVTPQ